MTRSNPCKESYSLNNVIDFFHLCRMTSYDSEAVQGKLKLAVLPANAKKDVHEYLESVSDFEVMKITDWSYLVK